MKRSVSLVLLFCLALSLSLIALFTGTPAVSAHQSGGQATLPLTNTKRPTSTATITQAPSITPLPTVTPIFIPRPTLIATPGNELYGTWTPQPDDSFYTETFLFGRPIPTDGVNYLARNYAYGSRDGGGRPTHHGADFQNPAGTPVIAVADGMVEYAGDDVRVVFGPQPNFYGNVVVIRHPLADVNGKAVYTLYGHLSRIQVTTGQPVQQGELIGIVGSTGVAVGAHLHLEVRVGNPNDYTATRNPELWMKPFGGNGAITGRVMNTMGQKLSGVLVTILGGVGRDVETYWDEGVGVDTRLGENFVAGDLNAGYHQVIIRTLDGALKYRNTVFVRPNRVTNLEIYITE